MKSVLRHSVMVLLTLGLLLTSFPFCRSYAAAETVMADTQSEAETGSETEAGAVENVRRAGKTLPDSVFYDSTADMPFAVAERRRRGFYVATIVGICMPTFRSQKCGNHSPDGVEAVEFVAEAV